ncbi:MutS-like protein [Algoriphagus boseongensis]|uniref:MutS-like protein n=1 Tax=Algoriphagus boseongensis TaxID=1442587 RepID=A0A4R6T6S2_9BACT|nr:DNA mismatch repair protein [Algoriphagus boseongensis]TDQ17256.1 MutS-like protein [Algoriphagus boseongensis]
MQTFDYQAQELDLKLERVRKKATRLSLVRLVVFFFFGASVVLGLAEHPIWLLLTLILGVFFIRSIQNFNFQKDQEAIYLALQKIHIDRKARQDRKLSKFEKGSEFTEKAHPFANDLDLFGEHSLFQLLNHCFSTQGKQKLAEKMKSSFESDKVLSKRLAVQELAEKPIFLEAMEAVGKAFSKEENRNSSWLAWLKQKEKTGFFFSILAVLGPLGGITILVLANLGIIPIQFLGLWILLGIGVMGSIFKPLKTAADTIPLSQTLKSFQVRSQLIEKEDFKSDLLKAEKEKLNAEGEKASALLLELDQLGLWVQNRLNLLYIPFNLIFWTDFLLYSRLVKWKQKVGNALSHLPENLENWEVWVSLGAFEMELEGNGEIFISEENLLIADEINHPLIVPQKSIPNSINLDQTRQVVVLTGANMSGKTTFMRTLGINCVLANLGLSPFGKSLTLGSFQLFTSMRNSDNLGESVSSFYAELSRIKSLIDRLDSGEKVFFLLDEILKGTNTEDRISGSRALIGQILETQGFGIISTHDVELAELAKVEPKVLNFSFHSEIQDQTILFDYLLKEGPCPSFNAHKLMELMGIRFSG